MQEVDFSLPPLATLYLNANRLTVPEVQKLTSWFPGLQTLHMKAVLRIRIHMFLGLPDPDPLVKGMDPDPALDSDPEPSIIMQK